MFVGTQWRTSPAEQGAKIIAVADHLGGVSNENGLDVDALSLWVAEHRTIKGFSGGSAFDNTEIIT